MYSCLLVELLRAHLWIITECYSTVLLFGKMFLEAKKNTSTKRHSVHMRSYLLQLCWLACNMRFYAFSKTYIVKRYDFLTSGSDFYLTSGSDFYLWLSKFLSLLNHRKKWAYGVGWRWSKTHMFLNLRAPEKRDFLSSNCILPKRLQLSLANVFATARLGMGYSRASPRM